ncbi:MAG: DUF4384 domain-containing protein [Magnetococcales bacterium]|nr:DUF4384 domain-containing protein [Magnetococcales bacterium]
MKNAFKQLKQTDVRGSRQVVTGPGKHSKKINNLFYLTLIILLLPLSSWGDTSVAGKRGETIKPDKEVRSVIRAADGYAYLGENVTLKEARRIAELEAKRSILEGVEAYVESKSKVTDGVLDFDVIQSETGGKISVLEHKDYGLEGLRYHYWIKAEVKYGMKPEPSVSQQKQKSGIWNSPHAPLTVRVWTKKRVFTNGEKMLIYIEGNRDFYARVVDFLSDGNIVQLLPNTHRKDNFFKGGVIHQIPDSSKGDAFELEISPPFGKDRIVVYASTKPLGEVSTAGLGNGMRLYQGTKAQISKSTRGIIIRAQSGSNSRESDGNAEFIESEWEINTVEN